MIFKVTLPGVKPGVTTVANSGGTQKIGFKGYVPYQQNQEVRLAL